MQANAVITAKGNQGTQTGNNIKTTISHIRPTQEDKASQLAIALNALTTNVYESTQINEMNVTDFPSDKQNPTMFATIGNYQNASYWGQGTRTGTLTVTTNSDGIISFQLNNQGKDSDGVLITNITNDTMTLVARTGSGTAINIPIKIKIAASDNFTATEKNYLLNKTGTGSQMEFTLTEEEG